MIGRFMISGILMFLNAGANLDPPVKQYFYVNPPALQKVVRASFPSGADDFAKSLESAHRTAAYERRPFFREDDTSFRQVSEFELFQALMALVKPALVRNETEKVDRFLAEVSDEKLIQGYQLARRGGSFHVAMKLTSDPEGYWMLHSHYRQFRILDQYQGPVMLRPTGIRKPPLK